MIALVTKKIDCSTFKGLLEEARDCYNWSSSTTLQYVCRVLFRGNIAVQLRKKLPYLELFVETVDDQRMVLNCLEQKCKDKEVLNNLATIFELLYSNDIIEEEAFILWNSERSKSLNERIAIRARRKTSNFIDALD
eukprot:TRINITY_DN1728_c0_g1_i2.p1 TRINITY_DN1728_c0_g1~~TRINITY_DN1728_c0_g1_i2.p1  ORF type:complete len:136 (-),score=25.34 TRINITY_DN1728_c0_g1_i2:56-463(-)